MAIIKPVINDFSSGEISPRLAGMVNSPLFQSGAQELLNMVPNPLGGATRRGPLEYIATIPEGDTARLIPWSVNDTLDFLLVMTPSPDGVVPGKLRILDVSVDENGNQGSSWLESGGVTLEYPIPYTAQQLNQVKYAQSIRKIILAQADHRMWYVEYIDKEVDDDGLFLQHVMEKGDIQFTGLYASSTEIEPGVNLATDPILADYFYSVLSLIDSTVTFGASEGVSGIINSRNVVSIKRNVSTTTEKMSLRYKDWNDISWTNHTVYNDSTKLPQRDQVKRWYFGPNDKQHLFSVDDQVVGSELLAQARNYLTDKVSYSMWTTKEFLRAKLTGSAVYEKAVPTSTFTINFDTGEPLVVTKTSTGLTGWLEISSLGLKVNNKVTQGNDIMDRVGTWMTPGVPYICEPNVQINGSTCTTAMLVVNPITGELEIEVTGETAFNEDGDRTITISRSSDGFTGRLSVDLRPFSKNTHDNPGFVAFHQNRMVVGGSRVEPNVLYMSKSNDYENFNFFEEIEYERTIAIGEGDYITRQENIQQIGASSAIKFQLQTEENESVIWAASVEDMIVGTATSEWVIPADVNALNPRIILTSRTGSADIQGRFVAGFVAYIPRSQRGMRVFSPELGQLNPDVMRQAEHLAREERLIGFDFRADPEQEILVLREDGVLLVGKISEQAVAWYRIQTNGDIESVASIAAWGEDAVYLVVKRGDARYIERLKTIDDSTFAKRVYLDSYESKVVAAGGSLTFARMGTAVPATRPVVVFADGDWGLLDVDTLGIATTYTDHETRLSVAMLPKVGMSAIAGYPYQSRLKTMRVDGPETEGTVKAGGPMHLRVYRSGDSMLRRDYDLDSRILIEVPVNALGARIFPYSGSIRMENLAPADVDQDITVENAEYNILDDTGTLWTYGHEPLTIQLISPSYDIGDGGI